MSSKSKKRIVVPSRPEPPSMEQIAEDINRAYPNDPVFTVLQDESQGKITSEVINLNIPEHSVAVADAKLGSSSTEVEMIYQQSRRFLELNDRLQDARGDLTRRRDELRAVGDALGHSIDDVKQKAGSLPCFDDLST
ncbi:UPF0449 protein C19orf25 homolog isoform X1 [Alosa pseudoharengus]|uniref:UPF0449 protein C19orf25 homolog isoform X1 n=1 Tax=Alosa sapidissima TaxID=34773 RepID=UPI001C0A347E|nr:UPF0449 protein C19orf25 homolog isoform X1 [Alosa sapidissima]